MNDTDYISKAFSIIFVLCITVALLHFARIDVSALLASVVKH